MWLTWPTTGLKKTITATKRSKLRAPMACACVARDMDWPVRAEGMGQTLVTGKIIRENYSGKMLTERRVGRKKVAQLT